MDQLYTGLSLHIGLNRVDPRAYGDWDGQLWGCENDARDYHSIAQSVGYQSVLLMTKDATIERVVREINKASLNLYPGDNFFLTYSGHGGQIPDIHNDEEDHLDETWCLFNGELIDDALFDLFKNFREKVRIIVVSDSCHSGTMVREKTFYGQKGMPNSVIQPAYEARKDYYDAIPRLDRNKYEMAATACLLSGCQDNQTSADGERNGLFTEKLLDVWQNGAFAGDYWKFNRDIVRRMPKDQTPGILFVGFPNLQFGWTKPFVIR